MIEDNDNSERSCSVFSLEPESSNDNNEENLQVERDEVQEVRKMSAKDTKWVRRWRYAVTAMLLITAVVITCTTYTFLKDQEQTNFEMAVSGECIYNSVLFL
jgi:hypothetical protein